MIDLSREQPTTHATCDPLNWINNIIYYIMVIYSSSMVLPISDYYRHGSGENPPGNLEFPRKWWKRAFGLV